MSQYKLSKITVVMLGVKDMHQSIAYYRDLMGLTVTGQMGDYTFLDAGGVTLCLSKPLAGTAQNVAGATEVVFGVDSVRAAYRELTSQGIVFLTEPSNVTGTMWAAHFRDPDGHLLSVFGPEGE